MAEKKDIDSLVKQFEDDHSDWLDRMDDSYDRIYTLSQYNLDDETLADGTDVTSPEPRRFADKIIQTCEAAKMIITVTTPEGNKASKKEKEPFNEEETDSKSRDKETAIERLCFGLTNIANRNLRRNRIIAGRTIQSADIFYGAIRGSMLHRVCLTKDGDEVFPDILPCDPRFFSFGLDGDGMAWAALTTWRDQDAIKSEYDVDVDEPTRVIDYWDATSNIIQIGDEHQKQQKHKYDRVPFVFIPVGAAPLIYTKDSKWSNIANMGEDIFAASRNLYDVKNAILTVWMSLLMKSHKPSYFGFSPGAQMKLEKLPYGTNEILWLPTEARMEQVKPPDIAQSVPQLFQIIDREIQANDLATIEYGMVAGTEYPSGKSLLALQEGKDSKITPILSALSSIWEDTFEMLIEQYIDKGAKTTVRGYDSKGKIFYQDIKPADVKKPWDIEVKFASISPEQDMQNVAKAQILQGMGLPEEYIYGEILQMQDPQKPLRQKRLQELEATDPLIKALHQYRDARKEGHDMEAQVLEKKMFDLLQQLSAPAQPQQLPQGQPPIPEPQQMPPQQGMVPPGGV